MCVETYNVVGLDDQRIEYEVEQYLKGIPYIEDARADCITGTITVDYDETMRSSDDILDEIEHSGCTPEERLSGLLNRIKTRLVA